MILSLSCQYLFTIFNNKKSLRPLRIPWFLGELSWKRFWSLACKSKLLDVHGKLQTYCRLNISPDSLYMAKTALQGVVMSRPTFVLYFIFLLYIQYFVFCIIFSVFCILYEQVSFFYKFCIIHSEIFILHFVWIVLFHKELYMLHILLLAFGILMPVFHISPKQTTLVTNVFSEILVSYLLKKWFHKTILFILPSIF